MKIVPDKLYSSIEAQTITGIKSRQYIAKYVKDGYLVALVTGKGPGKRYLILGKWLKEFDTKLKSGNGLGKKYSPEEVEQMLKDALKSL